MLTAQQKLQKLSLYAMAKKRLKDPQDVAESGQSVLALAATAKRPRNELTTEGISDDLLNLSGEDIAMTIFESLGHLGYV